MEDQLKKIGFLFATWLLLSSPLIGCDKVSLFSSGSSQATKAVSIEFNPTKAKYKAFFSAAGLETPVGDVQIHESTLKVSQSLTHGLYGDRTSLFDPQPLDLIIRGYLFEGATSYGDFYFETPVIAPIAEVNSINTALTILLRTTVSPLPKVDRQSWERMVKSVEFMCPTCLRQPFSYVMAEIIRNGQFRSQIEAVIQEKNTSLLTFNWTTAPAYLVAWSFPILEKDASTALHILEGTEAESQLTLVKTKDSTLRTTPTQWVIKKETAPFSNILSTVSSEAGSFRNTSLMVNGWAQRSSVKVEIIGTNEAADAATKEYRFNYILDFSNRKPVFAAKKTLVFKMNHYYEFDLSALGIAADPDGSSLSFQCVQCPVGFSTRGSIVAWSPTEENASIGKQTITLKAVDEDRTAEEGLVELQVLADSLPQIEALYLNGALIPEGQTLDLSEYSTSLIKIIAADPDTEDELILDTSGLAMSGILLNGFTDRGEPDDVGLRNMQVNKVSNKFEITFSLKPSYFQVEKVNSEILPVQFWINYSSTTVDAEGHQLLEPLTIPILKIANLRIFNIDDAPVFYKTITDPYYPGPFYTNAYNIVSGLNDGALLKQGEVHDININVAALADFYQAGSTLSYTIKSFDRANGSGDSDTTNCASGSLVGDLFHWSIPFTTPIGGSCSLLLVATNTNGLSTEATIPVNLVVTRTNLAPVSTAATPNLVAEEGSGSTSYPNSWVLDTLISDPNTDVLSYSLLCDPLAPNPMSYTFAPCPPTGPMINFSSMTWAPPYNLGSDDANTVIPFLLTGTDPQGLQASRHLYIQVRNRPAEALITLPSDFETTENTSSGFTVNLQPYRADSVNIDPVDQYNYTLGGNCDPAINGKIIAPSPADGNTASGDASFTYVVNLMGDYTKGDGPLGFKTYTCTLSLYNNSDPLILFPTVYPVTLKVMNKNRIPTGITASLNSNMIPTKTTFDFDYTAPTKLKAVFYVKITDLDGMNDNYTLTGPAFGGAGKVEATATKGVFKYTIDFGSTNLNCLGTGTSTIEKKGSAFTFTYKDTETEPKTATNLIFRLNKVKPGSCF